MAGAVQAQCVPWSIVDESVHTKENIGYHKRAADAKEHRRRRQMPGTATGEHLRADAQDETLCLCQVRTHHFVF